MTTRRLHIAPLFVRAGQIARLRAGLMLLGALVACSGDANPITGPSVSNVNPPVVAATSVASVTVNPPSQSVTLGESAQLTAVAKDANGNAIAGQFFTWTSSDSTIVAVSSSGYASGVGIGSAAVTATASNGVSGVATEAVIGGAPIASIAVTPTQVIVGLDQTTQFSITLKDSAGNVLSGRRVMWQSSDSTIMQVSPTGTGTPMSSGFVTVRVRGGGVTGSASATVAKTPGTVRDLSVLSTTDTSATLTFTQVSDGQGNNPASYDVRFAAGSLAWAASTSVTRGTCSTTLAGTAVGSAMTCSVYGLTANTAYQFAVEALRGTLNANAVLGTPSNVASASTLLTPVASVTVTPTAPTMVVGAAGVQFSAVTKDASGAVLTGRTVTWRSSNASVATISASGLVTSVAAGTTTITAASGTANGTAILTVTPSAAPPPAIAPVASVTLTPTAPTMVVGAAGVQFSAVAKDASGNVLTGQSITWSSSNAGVATISASGLAAGVAAGTTTITATSGTVSGTTTLTVTAAPPPPPAAVASVTLTPTAPTLVVGAAGVQFSAVAKDASGNVLTGRTITWSSSNAGVATISASGLAAGVAAGTTTITATSGTVSGTTTLTVTAAPPPPPAAVASVTLTPTAPTLVVGAAGVQFSAVAKDASGNVLTGRTITWSSSNAGVATISASGLAAGVAAGTTTITATSGTVSGTTTLTVTAAPPPPPAAVASVTLTPTAPTLVVGAAGVQFSAVAKDASGNVLTGRTITWSSSNAGVATISASGLAAGVAAGTTTITATSGTVSGTTTLTVTAAPPPPPAAVASVTLTPTAPTLVVGAAGVQFSAVAKDASGNVLTGRTITWSSSNAGVATISASGLAAGVAAGTTTITATSGTVSGTTTLTVTAAPPPPPPPSGVTVVFQDNFESGDFTHTQNGVSWASAVYLDVTTALAHGGTHAARFREGDSGNWSELRFDGLANLPEVYLQYYLYLPSGSEAPSVGPKVKILGTLNDKFFRLWGGGEAGYNFGAGNTANPFSNKVGASTWGDGGGVNGNVGLEYSYSDPTGQWGMGQGPTSNPTVPFITDSYRGHWVQIRIHARNATAANNDGVVQVWADGALILDQHALVNGNIYGVAGPTGYTTGYLLGYANNGWPAGQMVYLDDFTITTGGFGAP